MEGCRKMNTIMRNDNEFKKPDFQKNLRLFESLIELDRKVVGIKFLYTKEEFEEFPVQPLDGMSPYCTLVRNAGKGKSCKASVENFACLSAARALGIIEVDNGSISGKRHADMGVYKDLCTSRSVAKDMVYCKHKVYGVVIQPLEEYEVEPDILIIVTNPFNAMRMVQGYAYHSGQLKDVKVAGMQAICQECTSYPFETNQMNLSLMCSGTRHVAQWEKSEMGIGLPFHDFSMIVDGILNTVNPMERNADKKRIKNALEENDIEKSLHIEMNKNYYTNVYTGIKGK